MRQAREAWKAERQPKMQSEPHRLVFIDETGTNTKMTRARGRCERGERLRSKAPFGHWKTQTFVAGLRCGALTAPWVIDAPMDRTIFETYVRIDASVSKNASKTPALLSDRSASTRCSNVRYEKGTALVAAYSPRLKRIGIQNWRRASTVAGMSRQAFDAQRGVAKGIAGRPASSTQWNRIGRSR